MKIQNVHGVTVALEGGWDGRELGLGGGGLEQIAAAKRWKQQAIEKRRGAGISTAETPKGNGPILRLVSDVEKTHRSFAKQEPVGQ